MFQVIGNSLPQLLERIPTITQEEEVRDALKQTSAIYKYNLHDSHVRISWSDPVYQCAYVFLYFVRHSNLVYEIMYLNSHHFNSTWKYHSEINVCSIGGGPGTDIAGVVAFLEDPGVDIGSDLRCVVLDLFPEWESSWDCIAPNLPFSRLNSVDVKYVHFDLLQKPSGTNSRNIESADLITFVKSFSTVNTDSRVWEVLSDIMKVLKPGAFILFIDNARAEEYNSLFKEFAQSWGLDVLYDITSEFPLSLCTTLNMEKYSKLFDYKPMRRCSVTVYLMQKPLRNAPMTVPFGNFNVYQELQHRQYVAPQNERFGQIDLEMHLGDPMMAAYNREDHIPHSEAEKTDISERKSSQRSPLNPETIPCCSRSFQTQDMFEDHEECRLLESIVRRNTLEHVESSIAIPVVSIPSSSSTSLSDACTVDGISTSYEKRNEENRDKTEEKKTKKSTTTKKGDDDDEKTQNSL
ncbi:uncharacterized protein [Amphiura filiformis]|uniref:uncharacterized protein n=1 Tax=Amphiura filiformis TaxID=82378 RepID=UPI003B21932C